MVQKQTPDFSWRIFHQTYFTSTKQAFGQLAGRVDTDVLTLTLEKQLVILITLGRLIELFMNIEVRHSPVRKIVEN